MFLLHLESQNIVFRIHITQIEMKFPFEKYITCTLRRLIQFLVHFDRSKTQFQYTFICSGPK